MKKFLIIAIVAIVAIIAFNSKQSNNTLRVGTEGAYMPWNGVDANGEVIGFEVELANEVCKRINRTCEFVKQDWDGIIPALLNNKYDVIMAGMTITDERRKKIDFSRGYADTGVAVASIKMKKANTLADLKRNLKGKKLGVQTGTISAQWAEKNLKGTKIRTYGTQEELNIDLLNGRVDAGMNDTSAWPDLQKKASNVKIVSPILTGQDDAHFGEGIGVGIKKDNQELLAEINKALDSMRADGSLSELATKWFGFDASLR
ncbi:MAG: transporter substrate-binding domain-containing protein [Alphaproteobacteria bacterium]